LHLSDEQPNVPSDKNFAVGPFAATVVESPVYLTFIAQNQLLRVANLK
jgi:hypothetical protein